MKYLVIIITSAVLSNLILYGFVTSPETLGNIAIGCSLVAGLFLFFAIKSEIFEERAFRRETIQMIAEHEARRTAQV